MKKITLLLLVLSSVLTANAQLSDPVKWNYTAKKIKARTYEVTISAVFPQPWHVYAQAPQGGGAIPTRITFKSNPLVTLTGNLKEIGKVVAVHEAMFNAGVTYFKQTVTYVQTITLRSDAKTTIKGDVTYLAVDDHQALPPTTREFRVELK